MTCDFYWVDLFSVDIYVFDDILRAMMNLDVIYIYIIYRPFWYSRPVSYIGIAYRGSVGGPGKGVPLPIKY